METNAFSRLARPVVAGLTLALIVVLTCAGGSKAAGGAHASVIGGSATTISRWPWQVAFLESTVKKPERKPSQRFICGGSLIAPTIVVTATHCAIEVDLSKPEYFSVIGGRTNLNDAGEGKEVLVKDAKFPLTRSGVPRYLLQFDVRWDLAVIELAEPIDQPTIKLAGPDEAALMTPGHTVYKTGWGLHRKYGRGGLSPVLRQIKTAVQPARTCAQLDEAFLGTPFDSSSQVCLGDPRGRATTCNGDSGGPGVVRSSDGYRLIGATSYGTTFDCDSRELSVDAAVSQADTREWVAGIAMDKAGVDVVGSGGTTGPLPRFCEVPKLERRKLPRAKRTLRAGGCRAGKVFRVTIGHDPRHRKYDNTVLEVREPLFVLREKGFRVDMVVAQWTRKPKREE